MKGQIDNIGFDVELCTKLCEIKENYFVKLQLQKDNYGRELDEEMYEAY